MYSNELEHHGILGQKWGVRRFQNADGSLKAAGKARAKKSLTEKVNDYKTKKVKVKIKKEKSKQRLIAAQEKLKETEKATQTKSFIKKKPSNEVESNNTTNDQSSSNKKTNYKSPLHSMSDNDLRAANERMRLESEYRQRVAELYPQQQSNGQKFVTKVVNDVISPVAVNVGKQVANQLIGQMVNKQMKADVIQLAKKREESK